MKVKFCGLTTTQDVTNAIASGATDIGLVFVKRSPRYVTVNNAKPLVKMAKQAGLQVVALFADNSADEVTKVIGSIEPDVLQFHGQESPAFCDQFRFNYWKAVPMLNVESWLNYIQQYPNASGYLLDCYGEKQMGGSGHAFEWFKFPAAHVNELILAGGLTAENVAAAVAITGAHFVDTSSGIECSPGVKSKEKMLAFMAALNKTTTHKPL